MTIDFNGSKSKWVKDMNTRMRVFNTQIFEVIYKRYSKDNKEWHDAYLNYNFNHLLKRIDEDEDEENITDKEFHDFLNQYELNLEKLKAKELTDKKAFPKKR